MDQQLIFGTFNVPALSLTSLSATFTAPSKLPVDTFNRIIYSESDCEGEGIEPTPFDKALKGILTVPPPEKKKRDK